MVLLGAALLAGLGAAAGLHLHRTHEARPQGSAAPDAEWFDAVAASRGPAGDAERTTCGLILTNRSLGVTEPVLPCHARILVRFGDRVFETEVIDNRLTAGGRQFEVTPRLAEEMGLDGSQGIKWRFAARS